MCVCGELAGLGRLCVSVCLCVECAVCVSVWGVLCICVSVCMVCEGCLCLCGDVCVWCVCVSVGDCLFRFESVAYLNKFFKNLCGLQILFFTLNIKC